MPFQFVFAREARNGEESLTDSLTKVSFTARGNRAACENFSAHLQQHSIPCLKTRVRVHNYMRCTLYCTPYDRNGGTLTEEGICCCRRAQEGADVIQLAQSAGHSFASNDRALQDYRLRSHVGHKWLACTP